MTRVVESVIEDYSHRVRWQVVDVHRKEGAMRMLEVMGMSGNRVPLPSIFIDGDLIFSTIPDQRALREYLDVQLPLKRAD